MLRPLALALLFFGATPSVQAQLDLPVRFSEVGNLTYQLDCLAGASFGCSPASYRPLWEAEGWLADPAAQVHLDAWRGVSQRYSDLTVDDGEPFSMAQRIRIAGLQARSLDDYAERLDLVVTPGDRALLEAAVRHFAPGFSRWWAAEAEPTGRAYAEAMTTALVTYEAADWMNRFAAFYQSELPPDYAFPIHLVFRPPVSGNSSAQVLSNYAVVEFLPGETPLDRIDVVTHEAAHFLYASASPERREATAAWFAEREAEQPGAIPALLLLNEAVATALGNGRVGEVLVADSAAWAQRLTIDRSLYAIPSVDRAAKAILPWLPAYMDGGGTLHDDAFRTRYLASVREAFGDDLLTPSQYLRHVTFLRSEHFSDALWNALFQSIQLSALDTPDGSCCEPAWFEALTEKPHQSALAIISPGELAAFAGGAGLPDALVAAVEAALQDGAPTVAAYRRTPLAYLYIVAAETQAEAEAGLRALGAAPSFEGVLVWAWPEAP